MSERTDIPSLCHHQWQRCSCKAPKNEARQQMAHGPIGQGWSLEFQVWPSPIISLCLQLIFRAKLDGRWTMQLKVLADLNLWRPQSLRRLFLGMGSKHQVISSRYHDHTWSMGQIGPGVCSCWSGYHMISPSVKSRKHVLCSQDAEEIDGNRHQVEIVGQKNQVFSEITWK